MRLTSRLDDDEIDRLRRATRAVLSEWIERLRDEAADGFPEKVTAFREEMAVHGRFRESCPDCGSPVQRIRYAEGECNYCAKCQNQGRLLADRSLSKLLKKDWPKTLDELEARRKRR
jgi:formamidopyrimidine-DNA glycosylase